MGLFSDTKKYPFCLIANNTPFTFGEFKETFISFLATEECKNYFSSKDFAIEGDLVLVDTNDEQFENFLLGSNDISPYGKLNVGIKDKGEKQGYAVEIVTLEVTLTLKKVDKEFAKEFYKLLFAYYNNRFNPNNEKKNMFVTAKNNTLEK